MERREIIKNLITPEFLREHTEYSAIAGAIAEELGRTADCIELIPILGSPELMPVRFLQRFCESMGIKWDYDQQVESQRDITKRLFDALRQRGCHDSILKALTRGNDPEWYIEDLTYYNRKIRETWARFWPAYRRIFRYNISKLSGNHYIENESPWNAGFLIIELEESSKLLFEKLYAVLPAGRQVAAWVYVSLLGSGDLIVSDWLSWDPATGYPKIRNDWQSSGVGNSVLEMQGTPGGTVTRVLDLKAEAVATYVPDEFNNFLRYIQMFAPTTAGGFADAYIDGIEYADIAEYVFDGEWFANEKDGKDVDDLTFGDRTQGTFHYDGGVYRS